MIILKLEELIQSTGHHNKSNRTLSREIGMSHVALAKLRKNDFRQLSVTTLTLLLSFFKCNISDLLAFSATETGKPFEWSF